MFSPSELISLLLSFISVYLLLFVVLICNRYLRIYSKDKKLKFTQEEVRQRRKDIAELKKNLTEQEFLSKSELFPWEFEGDSQLQYIFEVFNLYNELAVGISAGIYDELYIKIAMGNQMIVFYKKYYHMLMESFRKDTFFMPLELLLKRWDEEGVACHYTKRGYK
jgi:hypothetical protein